MSKQIQYILNELFQLNISKFPGCMPVSIERTHLLQTLPFGYVASHKADGERVFLFVFGNGTICILRRDMSITTSICTKFKSDFFYVFDGELLQNNRLLIFDTLIYESIPVIQYSYLTRIEYGRLFCASLSVEKTTRIPYELPSRITYHPTCLLSIFMIEPKPVFTLANIRHVTSSTFPIDGFIFTQLHERYCCFRSNKRAILKYKERKDMTIDFLIITTTDSVGLYVVDTTGQQVWFANMSAGYNNMSSMEIWECTLTTIGWIPYRRRYDKSVPNSIETAYATMKNIEENITEQELFVSITNTFSGTSHQ